MRLIKKRGIRRKASLSKIKQEPSYLTVTYYKNHGYSIATICSELGIARSSYYKYKNRIKPDKEKQDELLCSLIREYHATYDGILGYRRMTIFINRLNQE